MTKAWRVERAMRLTRGSARARRMTSALSRGSQPKHRPRPHRARDRHRIQLACREHRSRHRPHHRTNMKINSMTMARKPPLLYPSAKGCRKDAFLKNIQGQHEEDAHVLHYDLADLNCKNTQLQAMKLMEFSKKIKAENRF